MRIISVSNQKGGVGKTTSAVNLSYELAKSGLKILLIDFDPQSNASSGIGLTSEEKKADLYDVFIGNVNLSEAIIKSNYENLWLAPGSKDLISIEVELGSSAGRELILKSQLNILEGQFDIVIIDCPPSSGLLTLNALGASTDVLIPLQAEYYALEGISSLLETLNFVTQTFNPNLSILGVVITMLDARTNLANQVIEDAKEFFKEKLFNTRIPRNIKLAEAPSHGIPIGVYSPESIGGKAYRDVAIEILDKLNNNFEINVNN